jgi:hypothetical protein
MAKALWLALTLVAAAGATKNSCQWSVHGFPGFLVSPAMLEAALLYNGTYDANVRPEVARLGRLDAPPEKVEIQFDIRAYTIDESTQTFQVHGFMQIAYYDWRLQYGAPEGCEKHVEGWILSSHATAHIWRPNLFIDNAVRSNEIFYEYLGDARSGGGTWIYPDGLVWVEYEIHHRSLSRRSFRTWDIHVDWQVELQLRHRGDAVRPLGMPDENDVLVFSRV